jgi:hypothetical protein
MVNERAIEFSALRLRDNGDWETEFVSVPVKPIFDTDIAKLPPELREQTVRSMFQYQIPRLSEFLNTEAAQLHSATNHLSEILLDYEQRDFALYYTQARHDDARAKYEADKRTLKGKRYHKRIDSWASNENPLYAEQVKSEEILREEVVKIFIKDYFLKPGGADELRLALQDLQDLSPDNFKRVEAIFLEASKLLSQRKKIDELFEYKPDKQSLLTAETTPVLRQLITVAFSEDSEDFYNSERLIRETAGNLLDFYWVKAQSESEGDTINRSKFVYDFLYAATASRDLNRIIAAIEWLENRAGRSTKYQAEIKYLDKHVGKNPFQHPDDEKLSQVSNLSIGELAKFGEDRVLQEWLKVVRLYKPTDEFMIIEGIRAAGKLFYYLSGNNTLLTKSMRDMYERNDSELAALRLFAAPNLYFTDSLWSNVAIFLPEEDMQKMLLKPEFLLKIASSEAEHDSDIVVETQLLKAFTEQNPDVASSDLIAQSARLREQHRRIKDQYQYFVALNGDRYTWEDDDELARSKIQSITFYPARHDPLNHIVDIKLSLAQNTEKIRLYLGEDGRLIHKSGKVTKLPLFVTNQIQEIVLPRLEFITSGAAFTGKETDRLKAGELAEKESEEILARRSHWRYLDGNRYTLKSAKAQKHIQEVWEDYGINTWQEILRRRVEGTLRQDQVLTYVRAVYREGAEPNIIEYDPSKLLS